MSFLHPTCQEVAALVTKRETDGLTFVDTLRLRYHMAMCAVCRAFERQMEVLSKGAKVAGEQDHPMPPDCKDRISKKMQEEEGFPTD